MVYFSVKNIMFPLFFKIWPFIVNAEVVVVVPVPKKELITLQESAAEKKNYDTPLIQLWCFDFYLVHTYACQNFHHRLRGVL